MPSILEADGMQLSATSQSRGKQVQKYDLVRELMHELGHATGLADHCTSPAIMNDGTPSCKQPWFDGMWEATDREGLYDVYHPHDGKYPADWQCTRAVSENTGLIIRELPFPRVDVNGSGRIVVAGAHIARESQDSTPFEMSFTTTPRDRLGVLEALTYIAVAAAAGAALFLRR